MIPKQIHFIYGLVENFSKKPFCFFHYLSVLSAKKCNRCEIVLHVNHEPKNNEWWDRTKELVTIRKITDVPSEIFGKKIIYPEHKCDILRLKILNEIGGIYLDIDTICHNPFDDLLNNDCVMGIEMNPDGKIDGLCNAVIMAKPFNSFLNRWLESYVDFIPTDWNQMPVRKPYQLFLDNPDGIHVEPHHSFFEYNWHSIVDIFSGDVNVFNGYSIHLWESKIYNSILRHITFDDVMDRPCLYNLMAKKYFMTS